MIDRTAVAIVEQNCFDLIEHSLVTEIPYCAFNGLVAKWTNNTNVGSVPLNVPGAVRVKWHTR